MGTYLSHNKDLRYEVSLVNIDTLKRKGWVETPQPQFDAQWQTCEWVNGAWVVSAIVVPVPDEIPLWALREALEEQGQLANVDAKITSLPVAQRRKAQNRWSFKPTIKRSSAIISALQQQLGSTDKFIDGLYVRAKAIIGEET